MAHKPALTLVADKSVPHEGYRRLIGELWTAQQRQMHSLHYVVSYRASFKPELPDFCIRRYSEKGAIVLDPFTGRGTTALQANLLGRVAWASDVNPLAVRLTQAKTSPAGLDEIVLRLNTIDLKRPVDITGFQEKFAPFYHMETYRELLNLRAAIQHNPDRVNRFIELLAISRLHGHSPGFFSVYSFPQISVPPESQALINRKRRQHPDYRATAPRLIKKAAQALRDGISSEFVSVASANRIQPGDAQSLSWIPANSVDLVVTSPPFLDKVDYIQDNWLECWFANIDIASLKQHVVMVSALTQWREFMRNVLAALLRVMKPGSFAVIEVGEVETANGLVYLDEVVADEATRMATAEKQWIMQEVLVNQQSFTKLANCFNIDNNQKGTNTNRLVVLKCAAKRRKSSGRRPRPAEREGLC